MKLYLNLSADEAELLRQCVEHEVARLSANLRADNLGLITTVEDEADLKRLGNILLLIDDHVDAHQAKYGVDPL